MTTSTTARRHMTLEPSSERGSQRSGPWLGFFGLCGVLSALFIVSATVIGGALREGYDPVRDAISRLYEAGAPNAAWLMVMFTAYHALVIPFAYGLHRGLPRARFGWVGPALLGMAGLLGIPLGAYARCDVGCWEATTFRGQLQGILVLVTVLLTLGAMFAIWLRIRKRGGWQGYAHYTIITLVLAVIVGVAMVPFLQSDHEGLFERISVGILIQWYAVMGIRLVAISRRPDAITPRTDGTEGG